MRRIAIIAVLTILAGFAALSARAQFIGPRVHDDFKDTTILRPPAGSNVAIIVFEDLGCPGCAKAHPLEIEAAQQYHVPIVRYDFPIPAHVWTFSGAVCARYLQDQVSPKLADQFRSDVFASQHLIGKQGRPAAIHAPLVAAARPADAVRHGSQGSARRQSPGGLRSRQAPQCHLDAYSCRGHPQQLPNRLRHRNLERPHAALPHPSGRDRANQHRARQARCQAKREAGPASISYDCPYVALGPCFRK